MLSLTLASAQGNLAMSGTLPIVCMAVLFLFACGLVSYTRLPHVPGPMLSKVSRLYLAYYELSYVRNDQVLKWHQKYGPVVAIGPNEVSVSTLEASKHIYGTAHRWAKSDYFDTFLGYNMRSVFATKPYDEHRAKRKLISNFYQASNIYNSQETEQRIQERSQAVLEQIRLGEHVDVYSLTDWYALDNITFLTFGSYYASNSVEQDCQERDILVELKHLQFVGPFRVYLPRVYGLLLCLLGKLSRRLHYLFAEDKLATFCQQKVSTAIDGPHLSKSHSLLRHLLDFDKSQDQERKQPLDRQYIAAEILDNINAAEATVAVTATYLIWHLTENPIWQRRIHKELAVLPKRTDGSVSFSDINSRVASLEACLLEVYRLHPASSGRAERVVPVGGRILSGFYLPEGTIVTTSVPALHHDKKLFPDPEKFCPERWLEADELTLRKRHAQLIPFGIGGRICLGKAFATMEIKLLIARLYSKYETVMTSRSDGESMKQCSTHDAVPWALECIVRFQAV